MLKMFTVFDSKADTYIPPFCMRSTGEAIRGFITILNDDISDYCKYPADFTLFEIGSFDPLTCKLVIYAAMTNLGNGLSHKGKGVHIPESGKSEAPTSNPELLSSEHTL